MRAAPAAIAGELDEFRLVRVLGRGSMGTVYLGYDTVLERDVAIKLLADRTGEDAQVRFLTEARALARLDHPNVIAIFRAGTTRAGQPYLVEELIRGLSLDRIARPVAPARVLAIGLGIARGLAAAHRRGILHRDVKPANVVLDADGTPKLLDFGLAQVRSVRRTAGGRGGSAAGRSVGETGRVGAARGLVASEMAAAETSPLPAAGLAAGRCSGGALRRSGGSATRSATPGMAVAETSPLPAAGLATGAIPRGAPQHGAGGAPATHSAAPGVAVAETSSLQGASADIAGLATSERGVASAGVPLAERGVRGAIVGTPRYLAPELWRGEPATARSDLYALGALLYELAAGDAPYPEDDPAALVAAVLHGRAAPPLAERAPALDRELAALIMACLAREPAARPPSADDVTHRLERIVLGAPALPDGNPYPGLAPLVESHRAVLFGRGGDTCAVVDRLRSAPVVVVAGDSGIGKSSLCRAGVLPVITAGGLGDRRTWRAVVLQVGRHAARAVRDALGLPAGAADLAIDEIARAVGASAGTGVVIFVDQLEELVTLNRPAEAAEAAAILANLVRGAPGVKLLFAVRGDFLTRVAALPALAELLPRSLHLLSALGPAGARDAVIGPAHAKGVRFESDALVDALASSIVDQPGALPLLSFALAELWQRRDVERAVIPAAALVAIGGVAGGLARHADAVIAALGPAERAWARRIALALVTRDHTRAERERGELCPGEDPAAGAALEALIRGRLVVARHTAGGAAAYELAHDALITAWRTLAVWRDDLAGEHALRTRLAAAAADWRRLGNRAGTLWTGARLAEAARLAELSELERAFLVASRAAVRRRRLARIAVAASLPAVALATWLVVQHRGRAARDAEIAVHRARAERHLAVAGAARDQAMRDRAEAFRGFDAADAAAEPAWDAARAGLATARRAYAAAGRELEAALRIAGARPGDRARMAGALLDQAELAELAGDRDATDELVARLAALDPGGPALAAWRAAATLTIDAPGAVQITVRPYLDRDGRRELAAPLAAIADHRLVATVPAGSYAIALGGGDGLIVRDTVRLARGEARVLTIALPRASAVPPGMVYVPAGQFLVGDASGNEDLRRTFLSATPLHPAATGAYLIAITEVTFGDWITYLRALPAGDRERRRPVVASPAGAALRLLGGRHPREPFTLVLQPTTRALIAREGELLVYPGRVQRAAIRWEDAPVAGISLDDARAYTAWLAATGRLPGARPCTDLEWERAARGADGRTWPHGDRLAASDANIDATYGRVELAYGPDPVGSYPESISPYGLVDTVGNAWEWVEDHLAAPGVPGRAFLRGGGWYHGSASAVLANRDLNAPGLRAIWAGLRVCATPVTEPTRADVAAVARRR